MTDRMIGAIVAGVMFSTVVYATAFIAGKGLVAAGVCGG